MPLTVITQWLIPSLHHQATKPSHPPRSRHVPLLYRQHLIQRPQPPSKQTQRKHRAKRRWSGATPQPMRELGWERRGWMTWQREFEIPPKPGLQFGLWVNFGRIFEALSFQTPYPCLSHIPHSQPTHYQSKAYLFVLLSLQHYHTLSLSLDYHYLVSLELGRLWISRVALILDDSHRVFGCFLQVSHERRKIQDWVEESWGQVSFEWLFFQICDLGFLGLCNCV